MYKYVGLYFAVRDISVKPGTETYYKPVPCKHALPNASDEFWTEFDHTSGLNYDSLFCPDLESMTFKYG